MCSILGMFDLPAGQRGLRGAALEASRRQRHRGPDWSGIYVHDRAIIAHERLAIVDIDSGAQPLLSPSGEQVLGVNGEIYNHRELRRTTPDYDYQTDSDCEVILALYQEHGPDFLDRLNGIYAFVLWDAAAERYLIARDPIGVMPLYYGRDDDGILWVASEMKPSSRAAIQSRASRRATCSTRPRARCGAGTNRTGATWPTQGRPPMPVSCGKRWRLPSIGN